MTFLKAQACHLWIGVVAALVMSSGHAQTPRSVDASKFDLAGVKLGMDLDQAIAVTADHFHVSRKELKVENYPLEDQVYKAKLPKYVVYEKDGLRFQVNFEPRIPIDKAHPLVADLIIYETPWTPGNADNMRAAALAKYGPPSNFPTGGRLDWCDDPSSNLGIGCGTTGHAKLTYASTAMRLEDPSYTEARVKFIQNTQAVKPSF